MISVSRWLHQTEIENHHSQWENSTCGTRAYIFFIDKGLKLLRGKVHVVMLRVVAPLQNGTLQVRRPTQKSWVDHFDKRFFVVHAYEDVGHSDLVVFWIWPFDSSIASDGWVHDLGDFFLIELQFVQQSVVELFLQTNEWIFHNEDDLLGITKKAIDVLVEYFCILAKVHLMRRISSQFFCCYFFSRSVRYTDSHCCSLSRTISFER